MFAEFVEHVICSGDKDNLSDEVAKKFAVLFYEKIFNENQQICEAFVNTQMIIESKFSKNEANKFKIKCK